MPRAFLIVLDSFGIGASQDASSFDQGANTLSHIAEHCAKGLANGDRQGPLYIPNLVSLGLNEALKQSSGHYGAGLPTDLELSGAYGYAIEQSAGKDTPSGHWEMTGLPVLEDWGYFHGDHPSFPAGLTDSFIEQCQLPGILGNCHASGTEILKSLGEQHIATGQPIVYTSGDSVFQIAAHEKYFGLDRLYGICEVARKLVDPYRIGRVIARPFVGEAAETFERTPNRRDLATPPFAATLLDKVIAAGGRTITLGKISDIFAHQGISQSIKTVDNQDGFEKLLTATRDAQSGDLVFVNLNDFDSKYGHRRNVAGYAAALEVFDKRLPEFIATMQPEDVAVISADHGCDPTWEGSDHTREHVPVLCFGPGVTPRSLGARQSFADVGQSLAKHLGCGPLAAGTSFIE